MSSHFWTNVVRDRLLPSRVETSSRGKTPDFASGDAETIWDCTRFLPQPDLEGDVHHSVQTGRTWHWQYRTYLC